MKNNQNILLKPLRSSVSNIFIANILDRNVATLEADADNPVPKEFITDYLVEEKSNSISAVVPSEPPSIVDDPDNPRRECSFQIEEQTKRRGLFGGIELVPPDIVDGEEVPGTGTPIEDVIERVTFDKTASKKIVPNDDDTENRLNEQIGPRKRIKMAFNETKYVSINDLAKEQLVDCKPTSPDTEGPMGVLSGTNSVFARLGHKYTSGYSWYKTSRWDNKQLVTENVVTYIVLETEQSPSASICSRPPDTHRLNMSMNGFCVVIKKVMKAAFEQEVLYKKIPKNPENFTFRLESGDLKIIKKQKIDCLEKFTGQQTTRRKNLPLSKEVVFDTLINLTLEHVPIILEIGAGDNGRSWGGIPDRIQYENSPGGYGFLRGWKQPPLAGLPGDNWINPTCVGRIQSLIPGIVADIPADSGNRGSYFCSCEVKDSLLAPIIACNTPDGSTFGKRQYPPWAPEHTTVNPITGNKSFQRISVIYEQDGVKWNLRDLKIGDYEAVVKNVWGRRNFKFTETIELTDNNGNKTYQYIYATPDHKLASDLVAKVMGQTLQSLIDLEPEWVIGSPTILESSKPLSSEEQLSQLKDSGQRVDVFKSIRGSNARRIIDSARKEYRQTATDIIAELSTRPDLKCQSDTCAAAHSHTYSIEIQ